MRAAAVFILSALFLLVIAILRVQSPPVRVENRSGAPVAAVEVEVGGQSLQLGSLGTGQVLHQPLSLRAEGPLVARVTLSDGRRLTGRGGYFTPGMRGGHVLTILPSDSLVIRPR